MSDTVEWDVHCWTVLGTLSQDQTLPAARLVRRDVWI